MSPERAEMDGRCARVMGLMWHKQKAPERRENTDPADTFVSRREERDHSARGAGTGVTHRVNRPRAGRENGTDAAIVRMRKRMPRSGRS